MTYLWPYETVYTCDAREIHNSVVATERVQFPIHGVQSGSDACRNRVGHAFAGRLTRYRRYCAGRSSELSRVGFVSHGRMAVDRDLEVDRLIVQTRA